MFIWVGVLVGVAALVFGFIEWVLDITLGLGDATEWVILAMLVIAVIFIAVGIYRVERRHDQNSLRTSRAVGEETSHDVAAAIVASHQHGGHGNGHG